MATTAFPVNPTLTAIAIAYRNPDVSLIADRVLPRMPTGKKFTYTRYSREQAYTIPDTKVGRKSEPTMVDFGGVPVNGECLDYGLDDILPIDEIDAFAAMPKAPGTPGPMDVSTMMLTSLVELDREVRVAGLVFAAGTYPSGNKVDLAGTPTAQFNDQANSDPLAVIQAGLDACLIRPNVMVVGRAAFTQLSMHPDIVQAARGTAQSAGIATRQAIADLFELQEVLVGEGFYNTARKGQAPTMARAWGKHIALLNRNQMAAQTGQPAFGFTAQWGSRIAGELAEPKVGLRGGTRIRVGESVQEVISASDLGYFIQNAVA